jgi:hypothetical protein
VYGEEISPTAASADGARSREKNTKLKIVGGVPKE